MNDIRYLLSIKELLEGASAEKLVRQAYEKLDMERRRKLDTMKPGRKYAECLGAGLLLQMGLQRTEPCLTVSQIITQLTEPIEANYTYGEKGKPYFRENPMYFSLSHSGDYVFCVFSGQEVGADIQYKKPNFNGRIVSRFFTEAEQEMWKKCSDKEEQKQLFYKLWTRKEAYGKLTGEGIVNGLLTDVMTERNSLGVCWDDYDILEDYQISICKRTGKKE